MKKFICLAAAVIGVISMTGCNRQIFDTTYSFERAIIELPNGEIIDGKIQSWKDYDGEQLQIKIDGKTYLVSSMNAVMISE